MNAPRLDPLVKAVLNEASGTWHLLGARGCGIEPTGDTYGAVVDGSWAVIRDHVDRSDVDRCRNCRWPPA